MIILNTFDCGTDDITRFKRTNIKHIKCIYVVAAHESIFEGNYEATLVIGFNHGLLWYVKYMARGPSGTTQPDSEFWQ